MKNVSIVGATDNIRRQLIKLFIQYNGMDVDRLQLFASAKSVGLVAEAGGLRELH